MLQPSPAACEVLGSFMTIIASIPEQPDVLITRTYVQSMPGHDAASAVIVLAIVTKSRVIE
jgi:hypothetical protein